jgi:hypothetical protein
MESWQVAINSAIANKLTAEANALVAQKTDLATLDEAARAYESDAADFCAGLAHTKQLGLPPSAETVTDLASPAKPRRSLVAINVYHGSAGYESPTQGRIVKRASGRTAGGCYAEAAAGAR